MLSNSISLSVDLVSTVSILSLCNPTLIFLLADYFATSPYWGLISLKLDGLLS
jgi:F0F1-type ATP synthase assembly protein I